MITPETLIRVIIGHSVYHYSMLATYLYINPDRTGGTISTIGLSEDLKKELQEQIEQHIKSKSQ